MYKGKKILAMIPARGGSKGVPRKNIRNLNGKPLIAWTIDAAKNSKYLDTCVVSTEDEEIKSVAEKYGGYVPFMRPAELARDDTPGIEPVIHVLGKFPNYDYFVVLQPTSPLRLAEDIDGVIERCIDKNVPACVSVTEVQHSPYWMYKLNESGEMEALLTISKDKIYQRQKLPTVYQLNGAVYIAETEFLKENRNFISPKTLGYIMPAERSLDIDTMLDFKMIELVMAERKGV